MSKFKYTKVRFCSIPYKMRDIGDNGLNIVVSIPRRIIMREARKHNLSIDEFLEQYRAVAIYGNFDGIYYVFEGII